MSRKINPRPARANVAATPEATPQASAELQAEVQRVYDLFDQAPGCMVVFMGPEHVVQMANPAYLSFAGLPADIVGQPAHIGLSRGYSRGFGPLLDAVYTSGVPKVIRGAKLLITRTPGGPDEEAYADFVLQPIREANGQVSGIFMQGHEVTQEKLAADELKASRERLKAALDEHQAIFDNSHDVICVFDTSGVFQQVNRHAESLWGYRPEEMVGRCFTEFVHPDDVEMTRDVARKVAAGMPTKTFVNRYLHKDGTVVPLMWSAVHSESQRTTICIGRDMREHLAAEEKLRQAQKMEAIGRLTGGIAHDFNNLLTVVIGSAEALADFLDDQPELKGLANVALGAAERGAELVSRLLSFARSQPLAPQRVDCGKFLESLLPILKRTLGCNIEVAVEAPDAELLCLADLTQLTSAMLNLCINARDAMPVGGRLTLRAARQPAAGDQPAFAVFSVEDTGEGMSPETRARALEPFFTTKPDGQGSGLGLSMVHGFVAQSDGRLEIASELGRGTWVRMCLPEAAGCADLPAAQAADAGPLARHHVLLVEDDDLLREQVQRQLTSLGCRITARRNAHDALRRLGEADDIDLLLTDIVMPGGMNGWQLAEQARRRRPSLKVLFTSGHTDEPAIRALWTDGSAAFLAKPYRRAELARKLTEVCSNA